MTEREIAVAKIIGPRPQGDDTLQREYDAVANGVAASLCLDLGHVWLETDGSHYTRHRGRTPANVPVICRYCLTETTLPGFSPHTAPPQHLPPAIVVENGDLKATLQNRIDLGSVLKL